MKKDLLEEEILEKEIGFYVDEYLFDLMSGDTKKLI